MRFFQKMLILFVFSMLLGSCNDPSPLILEEAVSRPHPIDAVSLSMIAPPSEGAVTETESDAEPGVSMAEDPYSDYESWCENIYKTACKCPGKDPIVCEEPEEACPADRTGKAQQCVHPQWSRKEGSHVYLCDPGWLNHRQQKNQREAQRVIVDSLCPTPTWAQELSRWGMENRYGDDPSKLCWHLPGGSKELKACRDGHFCQSDKLGKFLALVAARESTWNHHTSHELNRDLAANKASYAKARKKGWYKDSPHFYDSQRWARGYGWYGQNAALHVFRWDSQAPPEILCRRVESTEIYLRNARGSFRKLWNMYGDDKERIYKLDTGEEVNVKGVTWYDIHRAIASGKLYPEEVIKTKRWNKKKQRWEKVGFVVRARSKRTQLDPFETVMWEMLGEEIPRDRQNEIADEIRQQIRNHFNSQAESVSEMGAATIGG